MNGQIDAKTFYNEVMPHKQGGNYEDARWHKTPIASVGYEQTKAAIDTWLKTLPERTSVLELGPGAGTWSALLTRQFPAAAFTLVDISREMLDRAAAQLNNDAIEYIETDFADLKTDKQFELFFSSRVVEYIVDKEAFATKLASVLAPGARGVLITKLPHYSRMKLQGKRVPALHQGQVTPVVLTKHFTSAGLTVTRVRPVTVSVPFLRSARLNRLVGKVVQKLPVTFVTYPFIESYLVEFKK